MLLEEACESFPYRLGKGRCSSKPGLDSSGVNTLCYPASLFVSSLECCARSGLIFMFSPRAKRQGVMSHPGSMFSFFLQHSLPFNTLAIECTLSLQGLYHNNIDRNDISPGLRFQCPTAFPNFIVIVLGHHVICKQPLEPYYISHII